MDNSIRRMTERQWRVCGIAGILFAALSLVGVDSNAQPPPYSEEHTALATWFAENGQVYRAGHFVTGFAFRLFYLPFSLPGYVTGFGPPKGRRQSGPA